MLWFCQRDGRTGRIKRRSLDALPSYTIAAGGCGDALPGEYWIEDHRTMAKRSDIGGKRRLTVAGNQPAPTVMAGGIGSVNTGQYRYQAGSARINNAKPPYRVPSMVEIAKVRENGYLVVSTFSGTGGSCLGYRMAGFRVLWANEFEPNAAECYRTNFPGSVLDTRDIREIESEEILDVTSKKPGEIDLLDGSPPCVSFSTAGKREKGWGKVTVHGDGTKQRSDDLFFEFARLLKGLRPRTFIAENVSGLAKGVAKGYFKEIFSALEKCEYAVEARLLDAQWLGVPQARQRIFFVGVRRDLAERFGVKPEFPAPLPYRYSVVDAIGDLIRGNERPERPCKTIVADHSHSDTGFDPPPKIVRFVEDTGGQFGRGDFTGRPSPTVRAAGTDHLYVETPPFSPWMADEYERLRVGETSKRHFNMRRPSPARPSPTIAASHGGKGIASVVHPTERRKFSIAELKRICSFSDDFILVGSYAKQWARLGNSVPPLMAAAVAAAVRDGILAKLR